MRHDVPNEQDGITHSSAGVITLDALASLVRQQRAAISAAASIAHLEDTAPERLSALATLREISGDISHALSDLVTIGNVPLDLAGSAAQLTPEDAARLYAQAVSHRTHYSPNFGDPGSTLRPIVRLHANAIKRRAAHENSPSPHGQMIALEAARFVSQLDDLLGDALMEIQVANNVPLKRIAATAKIPQPAARKLHEAALKRLASQHLRAKDPVRRAVAIIQNDATICAQVKAAATALLKLDRPDARLQALALANAFVAADL